MPSDARAASAGMDIASVRILRLALGTALSMWFSQVVGWQLSFVAPVFTLLVLASPLPVLNFKSALGIVFALAASAYGGLALLPFILDQRMVGIGLLSLALFHTFYFTARGGSPIIGTLATIGLALATSIGTVSIDAVLGIVNGLVTGAVVGILFIWLAHAMLPDSLAVAGGAAEPAKTDTNKPDLAVARRSAWRSLLVVLPIILWFLLSSASASYAGVLIKVAAMGQQAGLDQTRQAGKSLLASTVIGGIGAIVAWQVLSAWTSLAMYVLMIGLMGLLTGARIFVGQGLHKHAATWSYGFLTMIIILAPSVLDGQAGASAGAAFWSRLWMFVFATIYAVAAVYVFDTLWRRKKSAARA